jgi:hypothetical protein
VVKYNEKKSFYSFSFLLEKIITLFTFLEHNNSVNKKIKRGA